MRIYYPGTGPAGAPTLRLDQLEAIYRIKQEITDPARSKAALLGAGMGSGKGQPLDSSVLTLTGFIRMGDVRVGTEVVVPSGGTAIVSGVFPQGERRVYRFTLMDGREILADDSHLWTVLDHNRHPSGYRKVVSTSEMLGQFQKLSGAGPRYFIEVARPADLGKWASSLDPWLIGALLGNGGLTQASVMFSTGDDDTRDLVARLLPSGVVLRYAEKYDYQITAGRLGGSLRNPVLNELRRLGVMGHGAWTKSVPTELLHSSAADRLALIQGLLDADGSPVRAGFEFSSASPQLAEDFVWLVRSLGGRATQSVKTLDGKEYQRIYGRLPEEFAPFRCQRKLDGMIAETKYALTGVAIRNIEYVGMMPTQCIMVDHESHEYVTDGFTRTHNTVVLTEVILQTNPERCLIVGVKDAYGQWAKTFQEQQASSPLGIKRALLRLDKTPVGQDNFTKLLDGDPGLFYVGLEMLRAQDWDMVSETHPVDPALKAEFGDQVPDFWPETRKSVQKHRYAKMRAVDLLVSDEAHKHSNQKTSSVKTMNDLPAVAKVGLSGTFFGNKFQNAWTLSCWLWGVGVIGGKGLFESRYCVKMPVMSKDGKVQLTSPNGHPLTKVLGEREPGEFVGSLPCYVFIATPIGPVPPPEIVKVALGEEQTRQYREMEGQSLTWIPSTASASREPLIADLPIVQRIRLRTAALGGMTIIPGATEDDSDSVTFAPGCKSSTLDAAYAVLHRPTWVGKKVLILTHSKPFAIEAARRIGQKYRVALKTGDVTSKQWEMDKASFMWPVSETFGVQYLVAVISAVGTATDGLQANCAKVLWLSEDENATNVIQAANRVWRDGVDLDDYEAVKIVTKGTIAEGVLLANRAKVAGINSSVQGQK